MSEPAARPGPRSAALEIVIKLPEGEPIGARVSRELLHRPDIARQLEEPVQALLRPLITEHSVTVPVRCNCVRD